MKLLLDNLPLGLKSQRQPLAQCLEAMNQALPLREVYLFGSHARVEARADSDVDLCIVAVLVVHHSRKDSNGSRPGQALRGSSDLHGWGDSNLYMRRRRDQLTLSTEHRAAPSRDHIPLQLMAIDSALNLSILADPPPKSDGPSPTECVHRVLAQQNGPISLSRLRQLCGLRTATVSTALNQLLEQGVVQRGPDGYQIKPP